MEGHRSTGARTDARSDTGPNTRADTRSNPDALLRIVCKRERVEHVGL